jgi:hypothetical protein
MSFYPDPSPIPGILLTTDFVVEPLTPEHTRRDYRALVESRYALRLWSGSDWPADDFSLTDNRADLARHADEHERRVAFTYTVLSPDRQRCLGCLYIKPLSEALGSAAAGDSLTRFWVTQPLVPAGLDRALLHALLTWFRSNQWALGRICFHTPAIHAQQVVLFDDSPLTRIGVVPILDRGGAQALYELL